MRALLLLLVLNSVQASAWADSNVDLARKIDELEKKQDDMLQQLSSEHGNTRTFLNDQISLGGFFDTAFSGIWGPATKTQFSATPSTFAINLAADVDGGFRFNSQTSFGISFPLTNPQNDPRGASLGLPESREFGPFTTSPTIPQAYLEYSKDPGLVVEFGRGYVPFGIAFQLRDSVLFRRRGGPQMISANQPDTIAIAEPTWGGVHLSGSYRFQVGQWGYDAYTITPMSNPQSVGGGLRAWLGATPGLTVGLSSQAGKQGGLTYEAIGADASLKAGRVGLDAELAVNLKTDSDSSTSFYVEPYYNLIGEKLLVYAAIDYLGNPGAQTEFNNTRIPDPYQKWVFGGGLNWLPSRFTRFRLGFLVNDYSGSSAEALGVDRDYYSFDLSAGVEF